MSYLEAPSDPYDPAVRNLTPETPSLGRVISESLRQHSLGTRVAMPAAVTAVHGNQLVDIQPLLQGRYVNGTVATLPVVVQVPVCAPMGAAWSLKLPLAVGDTGIALVCDRSLDAWAAGNGGITDPQDCRAHDLDDAVFVPGLVPTANQTTDTTDDLVATNGQAALRLAPSGQVSLGNGTQELVSLAAQLASSVQALCNLLATQAFTLTAMGPQPFIASTVAALNAQAQTAQTILSNLNSIKYSGNPGIPT